MYVHRSAGPESMNKSSGKKELPANVMGCIMFSVILHPGPVGLETDAYR